MPKIDAAIRKAWEKNPGELFDLIVRVSGSVGARSATLEERGVGVRRRFRLTRAIGIRCSGKTALGLLDVPWITRIEPDRPVKALGR